MKINELTFIDQSFIYPVRDGDLIYQCIGCNQKYDIENFFYTCPSCKQIFLIEDLNINRLSYLSPVKWRRIFDLRRMLNFSIFKGVFRYYELIAPIIPAECIVYLGEGDTPLIRASSYLREFLSQDFCFKNDGQNPSASFKDRGMAAALSFINYLIKYRKVGKILSICASTGDTSASAALYAAYLFPEVISVVLLPQRKITFQQLAQVLGAGAKVFQLPGFFDDCMKVVEYLVDHYPVALLNSKNAWRIKGQESYAYEIAQDLDYDMASVVILVPIGNAGNISAIMSGFLRLFNLRIITSLPKIIGVQSHHANPVWRYYQEVDPLKRVWRSVSVRSSVAQAAMIGDPVSIPRVIELALRYDKVAGRPYFFVVQVTEQAIMDYMLLANRHGHIICTQGGEALAGMVKAKELGIINSNDYVILDATAHHLKFINFQQMYFDKTLPYEFGITPSSEFINTPHIIRVEEMDNHFFPFDKPLTGETLKKFVYFVTGYIVDQLGLKQK